jgi:hypothetical protein
MARPSSIEVSPFRKEIEDFIKEGKPDLFIETWLTKKGAKITRQTIAKYRTGPFNVTEVTRQKYADEQTKKRLNSAADEQIDDLKIIDDIVSQVDPKVMKDMLPKDQIKSIPQLLTVKYKILGVIDENKPVNINIHGAEFDQIMDKGLEELEDDNDVED